jgi:hypothetical protein
MKRIFSLLCMMCILLFSSGSKIIAQGNGLFNSCLIGTFNLTDGNTIIQIVNPNYNYVYVYIVLFNDNERIIKCKTDSLSSNDLLQIDVNKLLYKDPVKVGIIKIYACSSRKFEFNQTSPGIVGFQQKYSSLSKPVLVSECNLPGIPSSLLEKEFIVTRKNCPPVLK